MSDLTFNKIAAGVLASGLAIFLLREVATELFHQEPPEKAGYAIAVVEEVAEGGAAAEVAPDWGTVLPVANIDAGKTVSAKCASCHTFDAGGANGTGPNLFGAVGRKPGSHAGFAYSPAMAGESGKVPVWDDEHLNEFLKNPGKYVPGTKMTFVGLKNVDDRINMIAYLRTLGATIPVPAPAPAAAAAPAAEGEAAPVDGAAPAATPETAPDAGAVVPSTGSQPGSAGH
jgi:cytochrome c